ncbi:TPA: MFS transporter [Pseudomonas aeruginosa]|nr:MFS transporter [Pseudomonas aeruginosa]
MFSPLVTFPALYTATLLMLAGSGLFTTYIGLRLTQEGAGDLWVGGLMASYYFGLVCGGKFGHKLIASFGHIRSYVACAGIATVTVLLHALVDQLEVWLLLRFITGAVMMNQYMVIESWLNEQAESHQRGKVFAGYMVAVDLGLVLGQGLLALSPTLDYKPLLLVAICFASCLIPLAMTRRVPPAKLVAAPLEVRFFWQRVPQALGTIFIAGLMVGAFYGLAPVYANRNGLDASQSSFFVGMCIVAGFCAQWPLGWLSDRLDRSWLIRGNAVLLCLASIPMWGLVTLPYWLLLANGFVTGMLLFTLYPLAVALANDHVEQPRRVALSAMLLTTYGVGACIGPLVAGALMRHFGPGLFYMLVSGYAVLLVFWVQPKRVTGEHRVDEAPLQHVAMPDTVSPMAATLDPRVEEVPEELVVEAPANIGRSDGELDAGEKPAQS